MKILGEFQTTVRKALTEIDPNWESYDGLIICGTHKPEKWEELIGEITHAREHNLPFLGICFGHQLAAIEYARNILGITDATSAEFSPGGAGAADQTKPGTDVVYRLEGLNVGQHDGESYWNHYEVVPGILEVWKKADNFITCQFHPEYGSSIDKPHPLLLKFLFHAKNHS